MAPQIQTKSAKEEIVIQELGNSATSEGSRKRRKSIVSKSPTNLNGSATQTGVEINGTTMNTSPKGRKMSANANGIGSRGMLVVGK